MSFSLIDSLRRISTRRHSQNCIYLPVVALPASAVLKVGKESVYDEFQANCLLERR